jgi:hypothetical protein
MTSVRTILHGLTWSLTKRSALRFVALALNLFLATATAPMALSAHAQSLSETSFDIGSPTVSDLFVDPVHGDDARSGTTRAQALKTISAAWQKIPQGVELSGHGYRVNILPGTVHSDELPNYWESRYGTFAFPIILQAADGAGTVRFERDINLFDSRYLYLIGIDVKPSPAGDAFHCEQCSYVLMKQMVFDGGPQAAHETVKINQSNHIYIEESVIRGAADNAIDFVAVQHGHIVRNIISNAGDWCMYVKGGSAYLRIEANRIHSCGTGGFTAGQGTGFEFMTAPWIHYEAYDIKFINNIVHDTEGAGFGVNGGYNILLAYNTLYRVGSRSHVIEVVFGLRSCDGDSAACTLRNLAGGWGPPTGASEESIPNRNVFIFNNLIYNPPGFESQYQHFAVQAPRTPTDGSNIPSPARTDTNLQVRGNVIWNGGPTKPLGVGEDSGACLDTHPTCSAAQLTSDNVINSVEPSLRDAAALDFRPSADGVLSSIPATSIPDFVGGDRVSPPLAAEGNLSNQIDRDRSGTTRMAAGPVGAYSSANSDIGELPTTPTDHMPSIGAVQCAPRSLRRGRSVTCAASTVTDDHGITSVTVRIGSALTRRLRRVGSAYRATFGIPRSLKAGHYRVRFSAVDTAGQTKTKQATRLTILR